MQLRYWLAATLLAAGCAGEAPGAADRADGLALSDSAVVATGGATANRLSAGLIGPLTTAVERHGTAGAIDFCSQEALRLTAAIQDSVGGGVQLRRTTLRYRNPRNAPDSVDAVVLGDLHERLDRGETLPEYVVQRTGDGARYYRPLRIQPLCLQCHGEEAQLSPDVTQILRERYPDDRATGYREGDLRGVIRVDVPAPGVR